MIHHTPARRNAYAKSSTPIYIGERVIGYVDPPTFYKTITGSKHTLRRPRAICFDRCTLRDAAAAGATCAAITDRETGIVYSTTLETINRYAFPVHRGYGDQVGVILDHWSINGAMPVAKASIAQTNQERKEMQLALFGEVGR